VSTGLVEWWWRRSAGPDRLVLLAVATVRLSGLLMLGYATVLAWRHFPYPGWSLLLGSVLAAETVALLWYWLRTGTIGRTTLAADLPLGVAALVAGAFLARHEGLIGWTDFAFPYTVLIAFTIGFACRTLAGTVLAGLVWAVPHLVCAVSVEHLSLAISLYVIPSYLVNPLVGWTSARLLRSIAVELDRAWQLSVRRAAELAGEHERARHAWALHDRLLQTLETLARTATMREDELHGRVVEEAAWLRRFVETGELDQSEDLAAGLAAVVRAVAGAGVRVQLNDAAVRVEPAILDEPTRVALVEATHQALAGVAAGTKRVVVRAAREADRILVTILAEEPAGAPDLGEVDRARLRVRGAGGDLTIDSLPIDSLPYVELWVPGT
jgi:hypothetical protein